jgi:L-ascorbate metabolism protein UlaG (beta-lactamase superfamily)
MTLIDALQSHLLEIVRERDPYFAPLGHLYVETYIQKTLSQWGTVEIHEFKIQATTHRNLQLNLPSRDGRDRRPARKNSHYVVVRNAGIL